MATFEKLANLPVEIESYERKRRERPVSSGFLRVTTVIHLSGGGETGIGEDVTYEMEDQDAFQAAGAHLDLAGRFTLDELSRKLGSLELFPRPPASEANHDYRRWGFESAGLDLALRQGRTTLAAALGRELRPVRFVVSMRLGSPPSLAPIQRLRELHPDLEIAESVAQG